MVSLCVIRPDLFFKIAKMKAITAKERQKSAEIANEKKGASSSDEEKKDI